MPLTTSPAHLTFVCGPAGVRLLTEHKELCIISMPDAQIRHPLWPEGVYCKINNGSVYIYRPGYEATAALIRPNNNVQAHADGTFSWVPHHIPDGDIGFYNDPEIVVGVTLPQHYHGGINQLRETALAGTPETPYAFGGRETPLTNGGVGFGGEPRPPGGPKGWG